MRLLALLLLLPFSALAANLVAKDQAGNSVTLMSQACVAAPWLKDWKQASMFYQGKVYAACWRIQGDLVMILDSGGDVTPVPMSAFRPEVKV